MMRSKVPGVKSGVLERIVRCRSPWEHAVDYLPMKRLKFLVQYIKMRFWYWQWYEIDRMLPEARLHGWWKVLDIVICFTKGAVTISALVLYGKAISCIRHGNHDAALHMAIYFLLAVICSSLIDGVLTLVS